ncbi:hypothetical protein QYE76_052418 [Lolium multiflorum]|uniref:PAZ domain-containing protein n=1 Tax=Lolium multiflorum TaxID=4521 RepID=A0AAD8SUZ4_LOLMU|nr:hypothetical protein QYE76_052418 [Lolium multiflorum]
MSTRRRGTHSVNSSGFLGKDEHDYCLPRVLDVKMEGEEDGMMPTSTRSRRWMNGMTQTSSLAILARGPALHHAMRVDEEVIGPSRPPRRKCYRLACSPVVQLPVGMAEEEAIRFDLESSHAPPLPRHNRRGSSGPCLLSRTPPPAYPLVALALNWPWEMESQSGKGDPSKSPVSGGGKGDTSKPPASDGGKGDPSKSTMSDGGKGGSSMTAKTQRLPIKRPPQHATKGRTVTLKYEDGELALGEGVGRKVMKQLFETYASHLAHKVFAYDGEKGLFTVGPLPFKNNDFDVVLCGASSGKTGTSRSPGGDGSPGPSDKKRMKRAEYAKRFKVEIAIASTSMARIPMSGIAQVLRGGQESENSQEAIRVLDIILRQHSARQGCLLVKQSFFRGEFGSIDLGGGVRGWRGFHSSFRPTQNGLSLNVDLSTTMVVKPGPVIDFLLSNQNIEDPYRIDWVKAKRALNKLWISTVHTKMELKIVGLSEKNCNEQTFPLKRDGNGTVDITVYDYFMDRWSMRLEKSARLRCLNVGKADRPTYLPLEVCQLVPLQRYKKSLSTMQRSKLVEGSRQKPLDRKLSLSRVSSKFSDTMNPNCSRYAHEV